jgi:hypothetical protein
VGGRCHTLVPRWPLARPATPVQPHPSTTSSGNRHARAQHLPPALGLGHTPPSSGRPPDGAGRTRPPPHRARCRAALAEPGAASDRRRARRAPRRAVPTCPLVPRTPPTRPRPPAAPTRPRRGPASRRSVAPSHLPRHRPAPRPHSAARAPRAAAPIRLPHRRSRSGDGAVRCDGLRGRTRPHGPRQPRRLRRRPRRCSASALPPRPAARQRPGAVALPRTHPARHDE